MCVGGGGGGLLCVCVGVTFYCRIKITDAPIWDNYAHHMAI